MDGVNITEEDIENIKVSSKLVKRSKENEKSVIFGPEKKKRKYGPRKAKQKHAQAKIKEKRDKQLLNNEDESKTDYSGAINSKQNKTLNPLLFSYFLNMVQLRRNNLFMSLIPVSL